MRVTADCHPAFPISSGQSRTRVAKDHDTVAPAHVLFSSCTVETNVPEKLATRIIQTMSAVLFLLNMLAIASYFFVQNIASPVVRRVEARSGDRH
jgi:hypothetical protein